MKKIIPFLALLFFTMINAQETTSEKYFRHLAYNHVSPHIPLRGIHEIDHQEAQNASHYIFKYNKTHQITEIINHHYHNARPHPLTNIGAYKTVISYTQLTETRIYFDKIGNRMANQRGVFKEIYTYNKKGFKFALRFYDMENQPMESDWKIARYEWSKLKKLIIEKRFDLNGGATNISPYFEFGITGILYGKNGFPKMNYNLNSNLEVIENSIGIASYKDLYDTMGNHIEYSYHTKKGKLIKNQWGYAKGREEYDANGNSLNFTTFDENDVLLNSRKTPSNIAVQLAKPVTKKDSAMIKNIALGYLIALQELKPNLMKNVFHPKLAKRTLGYDPKTQQEVIRETTYEQMVAFAKSWNKAGNKFPSNPSNQVVILDIYNRMASVKLISDNWVEYLHLIQTNNDWDIINLLWQYKDIKRYPKLEK